MFDHKLVDQLLEKYPLLIKLLMAGVISRKLVRTMCDLDRWIVDDEVYPVLVEAGAVKGVSSGTFKATDACIKYLEEKYGQGTVNN